MMTGNNFMVVISLTPLDESAFSIVERQSNMKITCWKAYANKTFIVDFFELIECVGNSED